ncbi:MAG TPA: M23 family metallopeptidase [Candidatus Polarisedimenticolaceae bacterium]|nr:M23 family metallopeptidase [Candidatus Polarisedimenticolaceae bacterium]
MGPRREFLPRRRNRRNPAGTWLLAAASLAPAPEIVLRARALEPGEIVRVDVSSASCALAQPKATFLEQKISFAASSSEKRSWSGWLVIPLDRGPGSVDVVVDTTCADGSGHQEVRRAIDVLPKAFTEQKLEVESKYVNPPKAALERIEKEKKRLAAVYARRTPIAASASPFVLPVPGDPTSEFGSRRILNGVPKAPHPGIDLRASTGTAVVAAGPGVVAIAADLYYSGNTVILDHGAGLFTVYAHLSKMEVKEGATVKEGERLGLSGATGRVTGPHLHWGGRVGGEIFDPRGLTDPKLFP